MSTSSKRAHSSASFPRKHLGLVIESISTDALPHVLKRKTCVPSARHLSASKSTCLIRKVATRPYHQPFFHIDVFIGHNILT